MDGTSHFCESCGGTCDCGRDTDVWPCAYCNDCNIEFYEDDRHAGYADWDEEYE